MNKVVSTVVVIVMIAIAYVLQPSEGDLNPSTSFDLGKPNADTIQVQVTLSQRVVLHNDRQLLSGFTPNNQQVAILVDDQTDAPNLKREGTYLVTGTIVKPYSIVAKKLVPQRSLGLPHETIRLHLDDVPIFDKQIGEWRHYHAEINGRSLDIIGQFDPPGEDVVGYFKSANTFVLVK